MSDSTEGLFGRQRNFGLSGALGITNPFPNILFDPARIDESIAHQQLQMAQRNKLLQDIEQSKAEVQSGRATGDAIQRMLGGDAAPAAPPAAPGGQTSMDDRPPWAPPNLATVSSPSGAKLQVASDVAPKFQGLLDDLHARGYVVNANDTGGYNDRNIAGTDVKSNHAYGRAADINWSTNPRGGKSDIPPELARELAAKHGLVWGGDWQNPDPMHFEAPFQTAQRGGGVAARTGGTDVAGPGAGPTAPPGAPPGAPAAPSGAVTAPEQLIGTTGLTRSQIETFRVEAGAAGGKPERLQRLLSDMQQARAHNEMVRRQYETDTRTQQNTATSNANQAEHLRISRAAEARAAEAQARQVYEDQLRHAHERDAATRQAELDRRAAKSAGLSPGWEWDDPDNPDRKARPVEGGPFDPKVMAETARIKGEGKPLPTHERDKLLEFSGKIDSAQRFIGGFKDNFAGAGSSWLGNLENQIANFTGMGNTAAADWWKDYQRYKLSIRQGISGATLTPSEEVEFDKADINPGMTDRAVRKNLELQHEIMSRAHDRRVKTLADAGYGAKEIESASGRNPADITLPKLERQAPTPQSTTRPGWKIERVD